MVVKMQPSPPSGTDNNPEAPPKVKMCANDFIFGKTIGEGSFSVVSFQSIFYLILIGSFKGVQSEGCPW